MRATILLGLVLTACGGSTGVYEGKLEEDTDAGADARDEDDGDEAGHDVDPCDQDGDGFISIGCGGDDCCDIDPDVFPGQTEWFDSPNACGSWDYNCDKVEELGSPAAPGGECIPVHSQGAPPGIFSCEVFYLPNSAIAACGDLMLVTIKGCKRVGDACVVEEARSQRCR